MKLKLSTRSSYLLLGVLIVASVIGISIKSKPTGAAPGPLPWNSPPNYNIVYLLEEGMVRPDNAMAPSNLEIILGTRTVHSWNQVIGLDRSKPIDALIIHKSAVPILDRAWLYHAYRQGVVVAVFDVSGAELAEVLEDTHISQDGFASESSSGSFYLIVSRLIMGQPDDIVLLEKSDDWGKPVPGIKGHLSYSFSRVKDSVTNSLNPFAKDLVNAIEGIKEAKINFESGVNQRPVNTP